MLPESLVLVLLLAPCILQRSYWVYLPGEVHVGPSLFSRRVETRAIKVCQDKPTGLLQKAIMKTSGNTSDFHKTHQWLVQRWNFVNLPHLFFLKLLAFSLASSLHSLIIFTLSAFPLAHSLFRPVSHESFFCVLMSHFSDVSSMLSGSATGHTEFYVSCPIRISHIFCSLVELCGRIRRVTSPSGFSQKKMNVV